MHPVLWLTERGKRHQQRALQAAPPELQVTILRQPDSDTLREQLRQAEFVISERRGVIDAAFMLSAPKLRLIVRLGSLHHDVDLLAVRSVGVRLSCQPVLGAMMVAEHSLMMILALLKTLPTAQMLTRVPQRHHSRQRTDEDTFHYNWAGMGTVGGLAGKTVLIMGMGEIGVELARRLQPFNLKHLYYHKRQRFPSSVETALGMSYMAQPNYSQIDVLVTLLPYSDETDHLIDRKVFYQLPRGAVIVQAGSGRTLDEEALYTALQNGHLGGAALDTFEYEPLSPDHPLLSLANSPDSNVILTPHIAAGTQFAQRMGDYDEIMRFLRGLPLRFEIKR